MQTAGGSIGRIFCLTKDFTPINFDFSLYAHMEVDLKIIVTDRATIESGLVVRSAYDVISIRDPNRSRAKIHSSAGMRRVLHLQFNDSEPADWRGIDVPDDVRLFTRRQALRIWTFVAQSCLTVPTLVIHCHQGASRSPAVASAIARALGGDWQAYFDDFVPNAHVYETMIQALPAKYRSKNE